MGGKQKGAPVDNVAYVYVGLKKNQDEKNQGIRWLRYYDS
jgi:hypothetical protein